MASITWVGRGDAELSIWRNYDVTMMHQSTYDLARRGWAVWCSQLCVHHTHSCTPCAAVCTLIMRTLCKIPLSRNSVKVWGNKHAFPVLSSVAHYRLIKWNSAMLHSQDLMVHFGWLQHWCWWWTVIFGNPATIAQRCYCTIVWI